MPKLTTTNSPPQNKADNSNDNQSRIINNPKQPITSGFPAKKDPTKPVINSNLPLSRQSYRPKQPINNKGEETLDTSIHAHGS